ncbi:hypothetical protein ACFU53_21930 [Streptomyces sp. NPDC057474]|uniref:hypothetical protein n=1 Tax=Streptomyces sp. NPDC057474 TaxID=3346144 RepID=UPI0036C28F06
MTSAAALPGAGAVLRVVRGAAGRRLVRVAVLAGGLFVLGVLCGARASAADGAPTSPPLSAAVTEVLGAVGHAVPPVDEHVVEPVARHVVAPVTERAVRPVIEQVARPVDEDVVQPVADPVSRPVTEHVVRPVTGQVVQPVTGQVVQPVTGQVVQPVVENVVQPVVDPVLRPVTDPVLRPVVEHVVVPVGDLVESVTEGLAGVPSQLPPVNGMPSLPWVPGLPELPELPGWTTLPVQTLPVDVTPQESGRAGAERPGPIEDGDSGSDGERASGPASVVYGPNAVVGGAVVGGAVVVTAPHPDAGAGDPPIVRVPAQQNPDGLPTGALGRHSTVDNGGPRHAEPYALASLDRAPLSLVPGAPAVDAADGTRDRHRDIPEFPG